jgi:hypothetical protein
VSAITFVHHLPGKGVKRPDPSVLAARIARELHPDHKARLAAHRDGMCPLPDQADNSLQPPTNQGGSSACTTHSFVKGLQILTGYYGSMRVLYALAGAAEGENPLADDGRLLVDVLNAAAQQGVAPFEGLSPDGRNSDIWTASDVQSQPPNVCIPATDAEIAAGAPHKFDFGGNSIDPQDANVSDLVASCIAAGGVVYFGAQVGQAFMQLAGMTVAVPDLTANDPSGGGHALIFVGYITLDAATSAAFTTAFGPGYQPGTRLFKVQNSWGAWDVNGCCFANLAFVQNTWELHPLLPPAKAPTSPAPQHPAQAAAA